MELIDRWPTVPWLMVLLLCLLSATALVMLTRARIWAGLLATVCAALGYNSLAVTASGLGAIGLFAASCCAARAFIKNHQMGEKQEFLLLGLIWLIAAAIMLGLAPGFQRSIWPEAMVIKAGAVPFAPELRLQHVLVACVLVFTSGQAWAQPHTLQQLRALHRASVPALGVIAALLPAAVLAHKIRFDIAAWPLVPLFVLHNVVLVVVPEEVLFRGMLQDLVVRRLPLGWGTPRMAIWVSATIFALGHLPHGGLLAGLSFVAGLGYGAAYWRTGGLWGGVLAHGAVNIVHFALFSYPALA